MKDFDDEKKLWFEYLGRLNERARNDDKASGFTLWAVSGVIVFGILQLIEYIPRLNQDKAVFQIYILSTAYVFDLALAILLLWLGFMMCASNSTERRMKSSLILKAEPIIEVCTLLLVGAVSILNWQAAVTAPKWRLSSWPFWMFSVYLVLLVAGISFSGIEAIIRNLRHHRRLPLVEPSVDASSLKGKIQAGVFFGPGILGLLKLTILAWTTLPHIKHPNHVIALRGAVCTVGIAFLVFYVCTRSVRVHKRNELSEMEKWIVMECPSATEIKTRFSVNLLGESLRDWVQKRREELNGLRERYESTTQQIQKEIDDWKKIDKELVYERKGRAEDIVARLDKCAGEYAEFSDKLREDVLHLARDGAFNATPTLLKDILGTWLKQEIDIKTRTLLMRDSLKEIE